MAKVTIDRCQAALLIAGLALLPWGALRAQPAIDCEALQNLSLDNARVTLAGRVAAGGFEIPGDQGGAARSSPFALLPAFCRVALTLTPSGDSDIRMELWLPESTWNGKYMAVGNGAFSGDVRYTAMTDPLGRGYAVSSTDTGHTGNTGSFALGHPEKVIDFGWRAVHEMAVQSKILVAAYYADPLRYSYWSGCSAGGRQGMVAAQKFPGDFNGIIAGAPGLDWTGRAAAALRIATHLEANPAARLLAADRDLLYGAALSACDRRDGVQDGLIGRPDQCVVDPEVLACDGSGGACLTTAQVDTARMIYAGATNPASGRLIAGLLPGSEQGWTDLGWTGSARATGLDQFRYLVFGDPDWTLDRFRFETDAALAEARDDGTLNALDPNLGPFFAAGGKLIQYHGWADPQISPANTTQYYASVTAQLGGREAIHDSYRLFMAPGMGHCAGGPGPDSFDMVAALEAWVESGTAPDSVLAAHRTDGTVDRSRPLCPYPEVAVYAGSGSSDEAGNFHCSMP